MIMPWPSRGCYVMKINQSPFTGVTNTYLSTATVIAHLAECRVLRDKGADKRDNLRFHISEKKIK